MEIRAYSDLYLESAQSVIGHMFDFAINEVGFEPDEYAGIFANSAVAREIAKGNPKYVVGKTGPEIARIVIEKSGYSKEIPTDVMYIDRSPEYWGGWILAYYQWLRNVDFDYIFRAITFSKLLDMYPTYHEMDVTKFVETVDAKIQLFYNETPLKRYRELLKLSQKELSIRADVPLRQIQ